MPDRWPVALAFATLFAIVFVRRFRRSFGRQPFRPRGLGFVLVVMASVATLMALLARTPPIFKAGGAAGGVLLALWALSRTRFGADESGRFYVPDGFTGLLVLLLFFGRVSMRLWGIAGPLDRPGDLSVATSSPGTIAALFVLLGYYITYYGLVLVRGSRIATDSAAPLARPRLRHRDNETDDRKAAPR